MYSVKAGKMYVDWHCIFSSVTNLLFANVARLIVLIFYTYPF